jgi:hypothetical protein
MSALSRRRLFGLFAAAAATPVLAALPAPVVAATPVATSMGLSLADIVAATLRNRSAVIVDNLSRDNALLSRLKVAA